MRGSMVAGQIKVDHHQHPGCQQQPILIARQRRTSRFDRFDCAIVKKGRMGNPARNHESKHHDAADAAAEPQPRHLQRKATV